MVNRQARPIRPLPVRSEEQLAAERRESLGRAMTEREWRVYSAYSVEQDRAGVEVVRGYGAWWDYHPMLHPNLPFELAQVEFGDRDSLLAFVGQRGLLGYEILLPERERTAWGGWYNDDPLQFIWLHAYTVRHVLALYEALYREDTDELAEAMKDLAEPTQFPEYAKDMPDHVRTAPWWAVGEGVALFDPRYWVPAFGYVRADPPVGYSPEEVVAETIAEFVSANLEGVKSTVHIKDPVWRVGPQGASAPPLSRLSQVYMFDALVQAVWWHLANLVTGQREIIRCRGCGFYFERTDKRQEFCPPPKEHVLQAKYGQRARAASLCASRYRTRRHRSKQDSGQ